MGAIASKRQVITDTLTSLRASYNDDKPAVPESWAWKGPPGNHSPYPNDVVVYPGAELVYCFIDVLASYKIMCNTVNLGPQIVTTNAEEFLPELQACYEQGFSLTMFAKIPGVQSKTGRQKWTEQNPYQAIFTKAIHKLNPTVVTNKDKWELRVEKRILSTKMLSTIETGDDSVLFTTIRDYAALGARLVCAEPAGSIRSTVSVNKQYAVMGLDLFFNVPLHSNPTKYEYHAINVPTNYKVVPDATQSLLQIECDADWLGQMTAFLQRGWKLVDICIDSTALADAFGIRSSSKSIDAVWFFEKEVSLVEDLTPQYEGVILEYMHKVKRTLEGEMPSRDWRPVIAGMGATGWELTTIVQTPILVQSSFTTFTMKLLMFFQRPVLAGHQRLVAEFKLKQSRRYHGVHSNTVPATQGGSTRRGSIQNLIRRARAASLRKHSLKHMQIEEEDEVFENDEDARANGFIPDIEQDQTKRTNRKVSIKDPPINDNT